VDKAREGMYRGRGREREGKGLGNRHTSEGNVIGTSRNKRCAKGKMEKGILAGYYNSMVTLADIHEEKRIEVGIEV